MKMKRITVCLVLLVFAVQLSLGALDPKKYGENLSRDSVIWHDKCVILTGITEDDIDETRKGIFKDNSPMKNYLACLWLMNDGVDLDFNMKEEKLRYYIPKDLHSEFVSSYLKCASDAKTNSALKSIPDKVWDVTKCIYKKNPENFIVF